MRGAGDSDLCHEEAQLADPDVVCDVHRVIDLCPVADHGILESATIDRGIGADLYVVSDDAPSNVGDLVVYPVPKDVSKAIAPDACTSVNTAAGADLSAGVQGDV